MHIYFLLCVYVFVWVNMGMCLPQHTPEVGETSNLLEMEFLLFQAHWYVSIWLCLYLAAVVLRSWLCARNLNSGPHICTAYTSST